VIDKTGLTGTYDYSTNLERLDMDRAATPDSAAVTAAALQAIQDQLGLKAEPGRALLEILVIESAEKPQEN
jgi:uncharacterized protein (TIGR03435 family)